MSALIGHAKAMRALAEASRNVGEAEVSWRPSMLAQAAVYDRAAEILEAQARAETGAPLLCPRCQTSLDGDEVLQECRGCGAELIAQVLSSNNKPIRYVEKSR